MTARIRGEHDTRWGSWRPGAARQPVAASSRLTATGPGRQRHGEGLLVRRMPWRLSAVGVLIAVVCVAAVGWFSPARAQPQLPTTPRAWLDAYEAAAIDNPARVCSVLFAPQLAKVYENTIDRSCEHYFRQITSFSITVRRLLRDGGTAVLELRQTVRPRDWAVVLDRRPGGWQAVDLLAGNLAR